MFVLSKSTLSLPLGAKAALLKQEPPTRVSATRRYARSTAMANGPHGNRARKTVAEAERKLELSP